MKMADEGLLLVADLVCELHQLPGHREPRVGVPGQRERGVRAVERIRERLRVVEPAGDLERLAGEVRAPFGNRVIAQGTREACEQHRP